MRTFFSSVYGRVPKGNPFETLMRFYEPLKSLPPRLARWSTLHETGLKSVPVHRFSLEGKIAF